ncbi:hypothetical protein PR048_015220 [Dryococelus australis]|uniref:Uncharacterized protein n=1 Tax=Dryococelus australis TaxID=614101 RepID=A0ABQ9HGB6_9NEOP|nr:hypothetical protein PR048_015220 [Dryococelus australis]
MNVRIKLMQAQEKVPCKPPRITYEITNKNIEHITVHYNIQTSTSRVGVCKQCFLAVFRESLGFVYEIVKKKNAFASGIILDDQRD